MFKKSALIAVSLLIVILALAGVACGSDSSTSPVWESVAAKEVVPQKANLIAGLSLTALRDKDAQDLYDKTIQSYANIYGTIDMPETYDDLLKLVQGKIGIDLRDLQEAVVFADIPVDAFSEDKNISTESYMGAIINGSFQRDAIIEASEKTLGELSSETYKGYDIYVIEYEDTFGISASDVARLAILDENNLIIGSDQAVKDVIDVKKGDEQGLSGELLNLYEGLGNPQAKIAMEIRPEWLSGISNAEAIPGLGNLRLDAFKDMRMATLIVDQDGDAAVAEIKVEFSDSNSANDAKETIDGALTMIQGLMKMTEGRAEASGVAAIAKLMESLQLSVSGNWLTLRLELNAEQLAELLPMLQGMSSGE